MLCCICPLFLSELQNFSLLSCGDRSLQHSSKEHDECCRSSVLVAQTWHLLPSAARLAAGPRLECATPGSHGRSPPSVSPERERQHSKVPQRGRCLLLPEGSSSNFFGNQPIPDRLDLFGTNPEYVA